jgi:hypothetical protein
MDFPNASKPRAIANIAWGDDVAPARNIEYLREALSRMRGKNGPRALPERDTLILARSLGDCVTLTGHGHSATETLNRPLGSAKGCQGTMD